MRISSEEAIAWSAESQLLLQRDMKPAQPPLSADTNAAAEAPSALDLAAVAARVGGLASHPNHVPALSLHARLRDFDPGIVAADQSGENPTLIRIAGPRGERLMAPRNRCPALARLAREVTAQAAEELIQPLEPAEVREAVEWVQRRLSSGALTMPEIRQNAPPAILRPVERGTIRALHQETALHQVLLALETRGDLVTTLNNTMSTSEGPYRYHLRSRITPESLPSPEEAYREIASWYMNAFAPASVRDLVSWSGLSEHLCRRALGGVSDTLVMVEVAGFGDNFLVPERVLERKPMDEPFSVIVPWMDHWLQAYQDLSRFAPQGLHESLADRDLVLLSFGPGVRSDQTFAAHVRVVGSAREPRLQPQPWRPLAEHEQLALQAGVERITAAFHTAAQPSA